MTADHVAVLVAAGAAAVAALVLGGVVVVLSGRVRQLGEALEDLRQETVPLVRDARVVVDQAATEMVRVGDVLESTEAVSATVDSASRLAYRALANPVVKVLAYSTGLGSALRRLVGRRPASPARGGASPATARPAATPAPRRPAPGPGWRGPVRAGERPRRRDRRHARAAR